MSYYAVRKGRNPGIYTSWSECRREVDGFPYPKFRKFHTLEEAEDFIGQSSSYGDQHDMSSNNYSGSGAGHTGYKNNWGKNVTGAYNSKGTNWASVYTDGSCIKNGKYGARGGIGVYWGSNDSRNVSEPLQGRQTNNRAEIHASVKAIEQAKRDGVERLRIHTDSEFLLNSATKWMNNWKSNGWQLSSGGDVKNKEDFQALDRAQQGIQVEWRHVPGHQGNHGNEQADRLSRDGAKKHYCQY